MTYVWPETAFELQFKLLLTGSFYNNIIKRCYVILVLILIVGNLKRFAACHIYCQTLTLVILTVYDY